MNRKSWLRAVAVIGLITVAVAGLSACAAEAKPAVTPSATNDILTKILPADVSAKGVLLAAVLLSTADISSAVESGLVTPAEVATAQQAINDNTLDIWRQRAEADLNK
ncbi:hypothetical protein [Aurantimicrobium sp. MWH-Uga1]|uniref:hypothetical protein n=1 Tax=Aurantimicrobium sp. MWH-Uga1 TaxID=2079575 RepID=UPI000DED4A42|nr:hypothetical protein [Aurantimicrobium sp. MWH-Uga1]AXE55174.1 hypothetical protein AURUGA1_01504 [Aurantimicrobium sp. MWH-Uga1]